MDSNTGVRGGTGTGRCVSLRRCEKLNDENKGTMGISEYADKQGVEGRKEQRKERIWQIKGRRPLERRENDK